MQRFERQTGEILQQIETKQSVLFTAKDQRKATEHHLLWKDLPEEERFHELLPSKKHFVDTIRLIAYRAETILAGIVREKLIRKNDARSLVQQILRTSVDLEPDLLAQTLTVKMHALSNPIHDECLAHLCQELSATETLFPGTNLRLIYRPVGVPNFPRDQEP